MTLGGVRVLLTTAGLDRANARANAKGAAMSAAFAGAPGGPAEADGDKPQEDTAQPVRARGFSARERLARLEKAVSPARQPGEQQAGGLALEASP
eukprot:16083920-Heterocapsa_arctica.AAC.1